MGSDVMAGECQSTAQCRGDELCVEGTCLPYRWYVAPKEDAFSVEDVLTSVTDSTSLTDVFELETDDGSLAEITEDEEVSDVDSPEDVQPDVPKTVTAVIQEDDFDEGKGEKTVSLALGEAWVVDLQVPLNGAVVGFQAAVDDILSDVSCGVFRVLLFEGNGGEFPDTPDWISTETFKLGGSPKLQYLFLEDSFDISKGAHRIGLLYDGECEQGAKPPLLVTDKSGVVDTSWYWKETPGQSPWIPGSFLGLDGRWVLRLLLEVPM